MMVVFWISLLFGMWLGLKRVKFYNEQKKNELMEKKQGRRRRVDQSEDAPTEMTQAELKAMGRWFQE